MEIKRTVFLLGIISFGTVAEDDKAKEHSTDIVNLVKDSFVEDIAKLPHFVMFFKPE